VVWARERRHPSLRAGLACHVSLAAPAAFFFFLIPSSCRNAKLVAAPICLYNESSLLVVETQASSSTPQLPPQNRPLALACVYYFPGPTSRKQCAAEPSSPTWYLPAPDARPPPPPPLPTSPVSETPGFVHIISHQLVACFLSPLWIWIILCARHGAIWSDPFFLLKYRTRTSADTSYC
jgi:hypothetical protein